MKNNIVEFNNKAEYYSKNAVKKEAYGEIVKITSGLSSGANGIIIDIIAIGKAPALYAIQLPSGARTYLRRHHIKPDRKLNQSIGGS